MDQVRLADGSSDARAGGITRREAVAGMTAACLALPSLARSRPVGKEPWFKISLAEWSVHRALFDGKMDNLDFPALAREFDIDAVEYVNQFFKAKAKDKEYLGQLNRRAADSNVRNVLIMIDGEGALGDPEESKRSEAIENHKHWVEAAKMLGCFAIRVNADSEGSFEEQQQRAADGLSRLAEFAKPYDISVIVENHGGLSSNGEWLAGVIKRVDQPTVGTLPDFGNFNISSSERYDRYKGVKELMPFAKDVSAKTYDFDDDGNETTIDYERMMKIVKDAGYHGYVGIEYEGNRLSEHDGIRASKTLLERVSDSLA